MERLSPLDSAFVRLETDAAHMHVGWFALLEREEGKPLDVAALRRRLEARLHHAPRFRRRLLSPPLGIGEYRWVDHPQFRLADHLHVLGDGHQTMESVHALCDAFLSERLDRRRPLWEIVVVPDVEGSRAALLGKVHHALVDGLAAVELGMLLFDVTAEGEDAAPPPWQPRVDSPLRMLAGHAVDEALEQFRTAGSAVRMGLSPARSARVADTMRRAAISMVEDALDPTPDCYLNGSLGPRRRLITQTLELERLLAIKRVSGVTLNDVVLALVCGTLRRHASLCDEPAERLRAMIPVNVRTGQGDGGPQGNRIAFAFVELDLAEGRPAAALARIHRMTSELKASGRIEGGNALLRSAGFLPGPLRTRAARAAGGARLHDLVVSNVPGPRINLFAGGARVLAIHPVIPLTEGHLLSVGVVTYAGGVHVGIYADPESVVELDEFPGLLVGELVRLERIRRPGGSLRGARGAGGVPARPRSGAR